MLKVELVDDSAVGLTAMINNSVETVIEEAINLFGSGFGAEVEFAASTIRRAPLSPL